MSRIAGVVLAIVGLVLIVFSVAGLYNSSLDTRLQLLIALGAAGLILVPIGLRRAHMPR